MVFDGFYNYRVYAKSGKYPGLNMSRALGDLAGYYDAGISCTPNIAYHKLTKRNGAGSSRGMMRSFRVVVFQQLHMVEWSNSVANVLQQALGAETVVLHSDSMHPA